LGKEHHFAEKVHEFEYTIVFLCRLTVKINPEGFATNGAKYDII